MHDWRSAYATPKPVRAALMEIGMEMVLPYRNPPSLGLPGVGYRRRNWQRIFDGE
jgi:hypothetical protein